MIKFIINSVVGRAHCLRLVPLLVKPPGALDYYDPGFVSGFYSAGFVTGFYAGWFVLNAKPVAVLSFSAGAAGFLAV